MKQVDLDIRPFYVYSAATAREPLTRSDQLFRHLHQQSASYSITNFSGNRIHFWVDERTFSDHL
ncbi:MAG TPA: hypothetical protein VN844_27620 [Pyrinomonadaceae bacterium]|nr:hypothetical protein [Pyrinomonadaceae bacterium]